MAHPYSTAADVRVHVAGAPATEDFSVPISDADGIIDAELRGNYDVPLDVTDDRIITTISAKLAAAAYIEGKVAGHQTEENKLVQALRASAMKQLEKIKSDPSMLSFPPRTRDAYDDEKDGVAFAVPERGAFTMGNPKEWG